jgi:hypothetical protein
MLCSSLYQTTPPRAGLLVGLVTTYVPQKPTERELRILFDQQGVVKKWLLLDVPAT